VRASFARSAARSEFPYPTSVVAEWIPTEQPSASQRLSKETKVAEDAESSDIESSSASSSHSSSEQAAPSTPSESAVVTAGEEKDEKTSNVDSSKQGERGSVIACRYVEP